MWAWSTHPDAIGNIRTLALPQETQALTPPPHVIDAISDLDAELAAARAAMPDTAGIDPIALRMRCLTATKNGDELAMRINELTIRCTTGGRNSRVYWL